ncbi:MAG: isoprenoid biosynthesis protein ElbB [Bacteroidetes bacterium HGW-Bacteroidetes-22]|nr:MAG: isoprenoid biosynthesis protein ElbB [Bacteroidetes bacterium HGW-Bacteroidetes-22]
MKRFAVIIAGCGVYDGAEIHETVLTLVAIERRKATYQLFAPDINQAHVINHLDGSEMNETRNVLIESSRIARGQIKSLASFRSEDFDALVFPGGFGVAKNLCNYAFKGADCDVNPQVAKAVQRMHHEGKPIGAMCIAPVLITKLLAPVKVTIGDDAVTASHINEMGGEHIRAVAKQVIHDERHNIFTTPCYMLNSSITEIADGCDNLIAKMLMKI